MTTVFDKPKSSGELTYSNKGSCGRLINYHIMNKEKIAYESVFFNQYRDNISPEEAKDLIDKNVKGLRSTDEKFYSLSINPSHDELKHIGNDKAKFKEFIKLSMDNYALNFKDKALTDKDIVWTGIIHETRYFTHEDVAKAKKDGLIPDFKVGDKKPGNQMHAHIIVSKRDASMNKTLSVRGKGSADKFPMVDLQKKNQRTFQVYFDYKKNVDIYKEMQFKKLLSNTATLSDKMPLDVQQILKIAEKHDFNGKIAYNVKALEKDLNRGKVINDPYKYIESGPVLYFKEQKSELKIEASIGKESDKITENLVSEISKFDYESELNRDIQKENGPNLSEFNYRRKRKRKLF